MSLVLAPLQRLASRVGTRESWARARRRDQRSHRWQVEVVGLDWTVGNGPKSSSVKVLLQLRLSHKKLCESAVVTTRFELSRHRSDHLTGPRFPNPLRLSDTQWPITSYNIRPLIAPSPLYYTPRTPSKPDCPAIAPHHPYQPLSLISSHAPCLPTTSSLSVQPIASITCISFKFKPNSNQIQT